MCDWLAFTGLRNAFVEYFFLRHPVHELNPGSHSECTLFLNMQPIVHMLCGLTDGFKVLKTNQQ